MDQQHNFSKCYWCSIFIVYLCHLIILYWCFYTSSFSMVLILLSMEGHVGPLEAWENCKEGKNISWGKWPLLHILWRKEKPRDSLGVTLSTHTNTYSLKNQRTITTIVIKSIGKRQVKLTFWKAIPGVMYPVDPFKATVEVSDSIEVAPIHLEIQKSVTWPDMSSSSWPQVSSLLSLRL